MGVSRIHVTIDRLVLSGLELGAQKPLVEGLQSELSQILSDKAARGQWARSHRTPVLKLGRMLLDPGPSGSRKFGKKLGHTIGKGLKP